MSLTIKGLDLYLTRGDDTVITVALKDDAFVAGDEVTMTARDRHDRVLFSKTVTNFTGDGKAPITIAAADTAGKSYGTYYYDIQYTNTSNKVMTIIPPTGRTSKLPMLVVCKEVTYSE